MERSGDDPWVRWATSSEVLAVAGRSGWACLGPWRPGSAHWGGLAVVAPGAPARAESEALALLTTLAQERGVDVEWFSTTDGRSLQSPAGLELAGGGGRWHFMWTQESPAPAPVVAGVELVELHDGDDAAAIETFGRRHNADFEGFPGAGFASLWLGLRGRRGELLGVGAVHELASGMPHLAGVVIHEGHRGTGLGRWLTTELTRRAIEEAAVSTLGVYSANERALGLYAALGYRTAHQLHTRPLAPVGQPEALHLAHEPAGAR